MHNLRAPPCGLSHMKRNSPTHDGKPHDQCTACQRQLVADAQRRTQETRARVKRRRLQRRSLRGICRGTGRSLPWR